MKNQIGFTLIELIIVIVILGILAATALPKFSDLRLDSKLAALEGLKGSMDSAAAIAHGTQLTKGFASNVDVVLAGISVSMVNGYPAAATSGIMAAMNLSSSKYIWVESGINASSAIPGIAFATDVVSGITPTCYLTYTEATASGVSPIVSMVSSGC